MRAWITSIVLVLLASFAVAAPWPGERWPDVGGGGGGGTSPNGLYFTFFSNVDTSGVADGETIPRETAFFFASPITETNFQRAFQAFGPNGIEVQLTACRAQVTVAETVGCPRTATIVTVIENTGDTTVDATGTASATIDLCSTGVSRFNWECTSGCSVTTQGSIGLQFASVTSSPSPNVDLQVSCGVYADTP